MVCLFDHFVEVFFLYINFEVLDTVLNFAFHPDGTEIAVLWRLSADCNFFGQITDATEC